MSRLIFALSSIILIVAALTIKTQPQTASATLRFADRDIQQVWGKTRGEITVRVLQKEFTESSLTLEGEIRTQLDTVNVEWKLPAGVSLSEGQLTESLERQPGQKIMTHTIKVNITGEITSPHIVFFAYTEKDGEKIGHSRVFSLKKSQEEVSKTVKIQKMMKNRGSQPRQ